MFNPTRVRICAPQYSTARFYYDILKRKDPALRSFQFVCLAVQVIAMSADGGPLYLCPGWQNLADANDIRIVAIRRDIELITL